MGAKARSMSPLKGLNIHSLTPLANFTTWRVGGPAEWLAEPTSIHELRALISYANEQQIHYQIIGAGSNLLIHDDGLKGLSLCTRKLNGSTVDRNTGIVEALAGEPIPSLARIAAREGLHGLEWAVGIPGTIGGAAVMNAGAQGGCIADCLDSVKVISPKSNEPFELTKKELCYGYRHSRLQEEKLTVVSARLLLEPGHKKEDLALKTNMNLTHRTTTQPYHLPSCGSVFRNPEPLKAGQLIENLGLKGHRIGGAEISKLHANFIVNIDNATAKDIKNLIEFIQIKVREAHGLILQPEVKQLGFVVNA